MAKKQSTKAYKTPACISSNKARWDKFCQGYVIHFDTVKAYKEAGFKVKSDQVARNNASRLMRTNAYVLEKIAGLLKTQEKRAEKTADDIIRELEKIGFNSAKKVSDRLRALELLGKRFGLFTNKQEISSKDDGPLPPITVLLAHKKVKK